MQHRPSKQQPISVHDTCARPGNSDWRKVRVAIASMKGGTTPGPDKISTDLLRAGTEKVRYGRHIVFRGRRLSTDGPLRMENRNATPPKQEHTRNNIIGCPRHMCQTRKFRLEK
ncbi:hypothetical protein OSTOST_08604 [Ostertagia ostertagi]